MDSDDGFRFVTDEPALDPSLLEAFDERGYTVRSDGEGQAGYEWTVEVPEPVRDASAEYTQLAEPPADWREMTPVPHPTVDGEEE